MVSSSVAMAVVTVVGRQGVLVFACLVRFRGIEIDRCCLFIPIEEYYIIIATIPTSELF